MPGKVRAHYRGDYARRAAAVRAAAYANPATVCWRCGLTLEQIRRTKPLARWEAGHVVDGQVGGLLRPEHSSCNRSAGAAYGNALREPRSRRWL
jgi:hypothetical protein